MNKFTIILIVIIAVGGGYIIFSQNEEKKMNNAPTAAMEKLPSNTSGEKVSDYSDQLIAGSTTQYRSFNQADYARALKEKQVIILNFYANWCPICRAEEPDAVAAFNSLQSADAIGFQVNFKDDATDTDEKALAQQFAIPYQHTKIILKDGKEVLKETAQWNEQQFVDAITKASQ